MIQKAIGESNKMTDMVDRKTRSRMMSKIKGKNTKPEIAVRQYLHRKGYRFRLHRKDLPGSPDIVLPSRMIAIFVHGCYWHRLMGAIKQQHLPPTAHSGNKNSKAMSPETNATPKPCMILDGQSWSSGSARSLNRV